MELNLQLLESGDEKLEKRGLQKVCEFLENDGNIGTHKERLYKIISRLQYSDNVLVRRWLYKTIGLLADKDYLPYLKGQIRGYETDEENLTWIVAAIYHLTEKSEASKIIKAVNLKEDSFKLAAGFFEPVFLPTKIKDLSHLLDLDDHLALKWFGLVYGNSLESFQIEKNKLKDLITRLNTHENSGVAEYSVWALHKSKDGKFVDSEIVPQNLEGYPPNVRRWIYRLLTKDKGTVFANFELIRSSVYSEKDISAREGLAIGLGVYADLESIIPVILAWFQMEPNKLVRIQLLKCICDKASSVPVFQEVLKNEVKNPIDRISKFMAEDGLRKAKVMFYTQQEISFEMSTKKVLLVVATDTELKILHQKFKELEAPRVFSIQDMVYWNLGKIKNLELTAVKSGMGYSGAQGSILTISQAVTDINPDYIIMAGIAFGLKENKQALTEILVSRQLEGYELSKVTDSTVIHRADKISASPNLISKFENNILWSGPKIHFGLILSGEKLVDSKKLIEELKKQYPEAIGGEMEGVGLQSVSYRDKKDWILIKGICDWGYNKDDGYQEKAMENVVSYLIHTFKEMPF